MPAVTQLTPNFLGGVSRQNDDKKLDNQVTECINGYPDPTYGLLKRPGMKHINTLKNAAGNTYNKTDLAGASWFFIERDAAGSYVGCIKGADIFVWTAAEGTFCTVTNNAATYLTGTSQNNYHFRSIQDTTIITNKTVATAMQASGTFVAKSTATLKLLTLVDTYEYTATIQGIKAKVTAQSSTTFNDMLLYDASLNVTDTDTLVPGTGYSTAEDVATTGGSGSGLTVDIVSGVSYSTNTLVAGSGYSTATNVPTTGGTGIGLTVDIVVVSGHHVASVTVNTAGSGYTTGDTLTITGGNANATFNVAPINVVTSVIINESGTGYAVGDTLTITGGNADATFNIKTITNSVNTSHHLIDKIKSVIEAQHTASNADFAGIWYLEGYNNSIVIRRSTGTNAVKTDYSAVTGTPLAFTIEAQGGLNNDSLEVFQDEIINVAKLPLQSKQNDHARILNSDGPEDDYYVKFVAYNAVKGEGYWKETLARDVSPGLDAATMPHQLVLTSATAFTFGPVTYNSRAAGDDITSPIPSFIGKTIQSSFFYSNRFGVLSEDNVIFGVANDTYNFFVKSALTQIDSDPIDLNVSSVRPVQLFEVQPTPQGLLLLSERQQFQVFSADGTILTPGSALIRSLSNYEMATDVQPVDVGTSYAFVSRVADYSKLFSIQLRDVEQSPVVIDISKAVLQWIPSTVDGLTVSPQNSTIILVDRDTSYLYLYRYYNNGKEDLFQAWTKWLLPGTIQATKIINDSVLSVLQYENEYAIGSTVLDEIPTGDVVTDATSITGNPCLDMATRPVSPAVGTDGVVYDTTNDITKIYVPYTPIENKDAVMLLTVPKADSGTTAELDSDQGFYATATERTEIATGHRYFEVKGNFKTYDDGIVVGYGYNFEATLPRFYFRRDATTTDYTATLTISRARFSIGKTGAVEFKVKSNGSNEWKNIQHSIEADYYSADTNPVKDERQFVLPIHQRNTNFELKVTSNYPYPVSLVSMMWEGNYSPRFYRRA